MTDDRSTLATPHEDSRTREATLDDEGVTEGALNGDPIVKREAGDTSRTPHPDLATLSPGDPLVICGDEVPVWSTCTGSDGLISLSFAPDVFGTPSTLYVDRDPYLLNICNGSVWVVDPSDVEVDRE